MRKSGGVILHTTPPVGNNSPLTMVEINVGQICTPDVEDQIVCHFRFTGIYHLSNMNCATTETLFLIHEVFSCPHNIIILTLPVHAPKKIFHAPDLVSRSRNSHAPENWARSRCFTLLLSDSADHNSLFPFLESLFARTPSPQTLTVS
jgi:hypothetical protein